MLCCCALWRELNLGSLCRTVRARPGRERRKSNNRAVLAVAQWHSRKVETCSSLALLRHCDGQRKQQQQQHTAKILLLIPVFGKLAGCGGREYDDCSLQNSACSRQCATCTVQVPPPALRRLFGVFVPNSKLTALYCFNKICPHFGPCASISKLIFPQLARLLVSIDSLTRPGRQLPLPRLSGKAFNVLVYHC